MKTAEILSEFNRLMKFFREECAKNGVSHDTDWWINSYTMSGFVFHCRQKKIHIEKELQLKYLLGIFSTFSASRTTFSIYSQKDKEFPLILRKLFPKLDRDKIEDLSFKFAQHLLIHGEISVDEFNETFKPKKKRGYGRGCFEEMARWR